MDTPITKKFYQKLELYLELRRQNNRIKKSDRGKMIWLMEKSFLLWAVKGHWHLGTPLDSSYVKDRLKEDNFKDEEAQWSVQVMQNLVFKGFAQNVGENAIQITDKGFMMGEVIEEADSLWRYVYIFSIIFVWTSLIVLFLRVLEEFMNIFSYFLSYF